MGWRPSLLTALGVSLLLGCTTSSISPPEAREPDPPPVESAAPVEATPGVNHQTWGPPASTPAPAEVKSARDSQPVHDGGKFVRLFRDPPTLDPHLTTDTISGDVVVEVFGGLVTINPDLKVAPDLAESWGLSPDGRVYTFHLRPNARFHNGKAVTAQDVRWSLERATAPAIQSPVASQYLGDIAGVSEKLEGSVETVSGIRLVDEHTLEIAIDAPKSYFLAKLTYPTGFVVDRENVESDPANWTQHPNGTGPFKLARYDTGEIIRLGRNEHYHLEPPHLDEVELILSGGNSMIMYENDEVHLTGVGLADVDRVQDLNSSLNAELHQWPSDFSVTYIGLNVDQPPLDDPKVRRALNLSIDRGTLASGVLQDLVMPANGIIPPGFPSYNPGLRGYDYDPVRARLLLEESRYGGNLADMPPVTLSVPGGFGTPVSLDVEVILQAWEELGVPVELQQTEWATFLQDLRHRRFQMFQSGWIADYPDPENFLDLLFHSQSDNNHTNYHNPAVDSLLEQARVEPDETTRFEMYNRIEQMVLDDAPWVPLWNQGAKYTLIKPEVKGYHQAPLLMPKMRYVYFDK